MFIPEIDFFFFIGMIREIADLKISVSNCIVVNCGHNFQDFKDVIFCWSYLQSIQKQQPGIHF